MKHNNTIRITGSEKFVKTAGDLILLKLSNYEVVDSGVRKSSNPKYKENFIRYIRIEKRKL